METFAVHKVDENLVVSTTKLPGFGKLGAVVVRTPDAETQIFELYYAGGFYNRCPDEATKKKVTDEIILIAQNYANRRKLGRVLRINYTTVIREKETA
jgi:hypothetical protein